jgi:hypothetical protein
MTSSAEYLASAWFITHPARSQGSARPFSPHRDGRRSSYSDDSPPMDLPPVWSHRGLRLEVRGLCMQVVIAEMGVPD